MKWKKVIDRKPPKDKDILYFDGSSYNVVFINKDTGLMTSGGYTFEYDPDEYNHHYWTLLPADPSNQPERSKREDSQRCEMRCSEHCGNTVRDK